MMTVRADIERAARACGPWCAAT